MSVKPVDLSDDEKPWASLSISHGDHWGGPGPVAGVTLDFDPRFPQRALRALDKAVADMRTDVAAASASYWGRKPSDTRPDNPRLPPPVRDTGRDREEPH